jgi:hypothetical protein
VGAGAWKVNGEVLVPVVGPWPDIGRGAAAATALGTAVATVLAWRVVAQASTVEVGGADTRVEEGSRDVRGLVRWPRCWPGEWWPKHRLWRWVVQTPGLRRARETYEVL